MTAEEALAALKTGDPIHVQGDEMRRFIAVVAPTVPKEDRDHAHTSLSEKTTLVFGG